MCSRAGGLCMYITRKPSPSRHRRGAGAHACDHAALASAALLRAPIYRYLLSNPNCTAFKPYQMPTARARQWRHAIPAVVPAVAAVRRRLSGVPNDQPHLAFPPPLFYATLCIQAGPGSDALPYHGFCGSLAGPDAGHLVPPLINHTLLLRRTYPMPPCIRRRGGAGQQFYVS